MEELGTQGCRCGQRVESEEDRQEGAERRRGGGGSWGMRTSVVLLSWRGRR